MIIRIKRLRFGVKLKFDTWCQRILSHIKNILFNYFFQPFVKYVNVINICDKLSIAPKHLQPLILIISKHFFFGF
jgi:hypothetical protein